MAFWDTTPTKVDKEAAAKKAAEAAEKARLKKEAEIEQKLRINAVKVTTGDIKELYEIIGPVYFQVSNKGLFSSKLSSLEDAYKKDIAEMRQFGTMSQTEADWGFLYGEWSVHQDDFEKAFFIATQELKKRAVLLGGDAIVAMRQDIDLDTTGFQYFYLQMYGTAVKMK